MTRSSDRRPPEAGSPPQGADQAPRSRGLRLPRMFGAAVAPSPLDLVLGQGSPAELDAMRARMDEDPLVALEVAEERQFVEALRELRTEPGAHFACKMADVVARAGKRQLVRTPAPVQVAGVRPMHLGLGAAAAAALFAALVWFDPLRLRSASDPASDSIMAAAEKPVSPELCAVVDPERESASGADRAVAGVVRGGDERRRAAIENFGPGLGPQLRRAFDRYAADETAIGMSAWLSSRNELAMLQIDFELRESAELRRRALRLRGNLPDVDDRVQELARLVGGQLAAMQRAAADGADAGDAMALAYAVRALLASGAVRGDDESLQWAAGELAAQLPTLTGGPLASTLAALAEVAAVRGQFHREVEQHGRRLLAEVVTVDGETWTRRRPSLLSATTSPGQIADAGRFLAIGSAFGLAAADVRLVRLLMAAHLQERRDQRTETPDLLVALCYGFGDLLGTEERRDIERRLHTWRPVLFAPDYVALQQLAWSRSADVPGFARFQLELRRVAAMPTPEAMLDRAALLLCLATDFALPGAIGDAAHRG